MRLPKPYAKVAAGRQRPTLPTVLILSATFLLLNAWLISHQLTHP